ncbi:MAG: MBL fold metallo-hydrolase [Kofleriaceae bacterium]
MRLTGLRLERARASARYRDGRFHNTHDVRATLDGPALPIMKAWLFDRAARRPTAALPVERPLATWATPVSAHGLRVTWLGHSTVLLEVDGLRVLTDPVFGDRLGPVRFAGPRRFHAPPVAVAELPPLDAVLVSHDHYDHLCASTIRALAARAVPFVTSLGVGAHLEALGVAPARITELDWWETHTLPGGALAFTATPAQHFSGRLGGRNATLWSSWVLETANRRVFFSGDTGLTPELADIAARFGRFDLTMLEIGAWHPAWGSVHLGPDNALKALALLGGGTLVPVHWSTFDLGLHPWAEPAETLYAAAAATGARVLTPMLGRPFEPAAVERLDPWWRAVAGAVAVDQPVPAA